MKSSVNIADHPIHPMLVLLPAGAWVTSFILDIVFLSTGNVFWFAASLWTIIIGVAGALIAAIVGMLDLFTLPLGREPRRIGITHMTLNLVIVALYIVNAIIRFSVPVGPVMGLMVPVSTAVWTFVLNLVSIVLLIFSGWYGGEMVYRYAVAVPGETIERAPQYQTRPYPGEPGISGALGGQSPLNDDDE
ncbi:MAG: DUF2231 domain-containing protein [Armatimonadota bacterium]